MNVTVLMSSGDEDVWEDVHDAISDEGALLIIDTIEGDEVSAQDKTIILTKQSAKPETFIVCAVYAPGMWMKVEYTRAGQ